MPFPPKKKGKSKGSSKAGGSPLDSRQRELHEEQSKVQARIEALTRVISESPKEQPPARKASVPPPRRVGPPKHRHSTTLADSRVDEDEAPLVRNKPRTRLRKEIRQAQLQTLALIVALVGAIIWALYKFSG